MLRPMLVCAVLSGGIGVSNAQEADPFAIALKLAAYCPGFEFNYARAEQVAVAMGMPPTAIPRPMNQLLSSTAAPNFSQPVRPTFPEDTCREGYAMFGPGGTAISGLLKPGNRGSGISE